jgi:hypothetical protein
LPFRQEAHDLTWCVDADGVARNNKGLVTQRVGDLVDDVVQHGEPQRKDDSIGTLQRALVVERDDRGTADRRRQGSRRLLVGARELQGLATGSELAGDGRSDPSSADDRGGHNRSLLGVKELTTTARRHQRPHRCRSVSLSAEERPGGCFRNGGPSAP